MRSVASSSAARRARSTSRSMRCPTSPACPAPASTSAAPSRFSPSLDEMEQAYDDAKYGQFSRKPYIDMIIPTLVDPSMAPARQARHQLLRPVRAVPPRAGAGTWDDQREAFGGPVIDRIAEFAPNIRDIILHRNVQTPLDIERTTGLTEGNIFQGELRLEQLFFNRPVPGLRPLPDADPRPVAVRLGDASRAAGSWARPGGSRRWSCCGHAAGGGLSGRRPEPLRRGRHRRRSQRPRHRGLPRDGRAPDGRPRAAGCRRWRCSDRRAGPGVRVPDPCPHGRPAPHVLWHDLELKRHGLRLVAPHVRSFAPAAGWAAVTLWADVSRTADDLRERSTARRRCVSGLRPARPLAAPFLAEIAAATPPDIDSPGIGDALPGCHLDKRSVGWVAATAATSCGPCRWRRRPRRRALRDRRRSRGDRLAGRAVHGMGPWSAARPPCCSPIRRAKMVARRASRSLPRRGPGALGRRSRARHRPPAPRSAPAPT